MDSNYISFKKAKVGGFNKKDVINYIEKMRNEFYDYKKAVESTIDSLNSRIRELEALGDNATVQQLKNSECVVEYADTSTDPISDINAVTVQLRTAADELCRNISDFVGAVTVDVQKEEATVEECDYSVNTVECECTDCDVKTTDKAQKILARSCNFTFLNDNEKKTEIKADKSEDGAKKSILDSLTTSSFFN